MDIYSYIIFLYIGNIQEYDVYARSGGINMYDEELPTVEKAFSNAILSVLVRKGVISHHEADDAMRVLKQRQDDTGEKAA